MSAALLALMFFFPFAFLPHAMCAQTNASGWYTPIEFMAPLNPTQTKIASELKNFHLQIPATSSKPDFAELDVQNTRLFFFKEIAEILENARHPQFALPDDHPEKFCEELLNYSSSSGPIVEGTCEAKDDGLNEALANVLASARKACLEIRKPESFVFNQMSGGLAPGVPSDSDLRSIEDLIAVAGLPLSFLSFPGNLLSDEFRVRGRDILLKIRYPVLSQQVIKARDELSKFVSDRRTTASKSCPAQRFDKQIAELDSARLQLEQVYQAGLRDAALDTAALMQRSRRRASLQYPALTDQDRQFVSMYLGGVYWRMRGGAVIRAGGTQQARSLFASIPLQLLVELNAGTKLSRGLLSGVGTAHKWALKLRGWAKFQSMGRVAKDGDLYQNLAGMTDRGAYQVKLPAAMLNFAGFDSTVSDIGGLQMGACYFAATWLPIDLTLGMHDEISKGLPVTVQGGQNPYLYFIDNRTSWGEFCTGAAMALGMSKALLNGVAK